MKGPGFEELVKLEIGSRAQQKSNKMREIMNDKLRRLIHFSPIIGSRPLWETFLVVASVSVQDRFSNCSKERVVRRLE